MAVEDDIYGALSGLVSGRVFRDVARSAPARPYITFQQVGGAPINFLESAHPGRRFGRFQINVWADDRDTAADLARQAEAAVVTSTTLRAFINTGMTATYEQGTDLFGTRQDVTIFF